MHKQTSLRTGRIDTSKGAEMYSHGTVAREPACVMAWIRGEELRVESVSMGGIT